MGNGEAKELICTTHGYELRWRNAGGKGGGYRAEGNKGEKKWDNCNSIIKIYFKQLYKDTYRLKVKEERAVGHLVRAVVRKLL